MSTSARKVNPQVLAFVAKHPAADASQYNSYPRHFRTVPRAIVARWMTENDRYRRVKAFAESPTLERLMLPNAVRDTARKNAETLLIGLSLIEEYELVPGGRDRALFETLTEAGVLDPLGVESLLAQAKKPDFVPISEGDIDSAKQWLQRKATAEKLTADAAANFEKIRNWCERYLSDGDVALPQTDPVRPPDGFDFDETTRSLVPVTQTHNPNPRG